MSPKPTRSHRQLPPLSPNHWPGWVLVGFIWSTHLFLPRHWRRRIGRAWGGLAWYFNRIPRQVAETNLIYCYPDLDVSQRCYRVREHFRLMGQVIWDYPLAWFGSPKRLRREVVIDNLEHLKNLRAQKKPVILMVAHTTGLDIALPRLALEETMYGPFNPFRNTLAEWLINQGRSRFGNQPITREAGLRGLLKALRKGGILYYLADEDYGLERSVFAPLFQHQKATLPIIGRLARASGAAVIPMMTVYDDTIGKYRIILDAPLANFPVDDPVENACRVNAALESQIRRFPSHYMWTLRLFKTRPPGEDSWYR